MSSKIEVSRELVDRIVRDDCLSVATHDQLRQALAAPVVERQPVAYLRNEGVPNNLVVCGFDHPDAFKVYKTPPELAELQATIACLESKLNNAINLDFERRTEIERLKSESFESLYNDAVDEIERLKGGQGGPVAFESMWACIAERLPSHQRGSYSAADVEHAEKQAVYEAWQASQPAPVSVLPRLQMSHVVEAHMEIPGCPILTSNQCHALAVKLNACLDKVKELNK